MSGPTSGRSGGAVAPVEVVHLLGRLSRGGGVQTVVRRLIAGVDPARVRISVVTTRPRLDEDGLDELPVDVEGLGYTRRGFRLRDRLSLSWKMTRAVRRRRPDIVQVHSGVAWLGFVASASVRRARVVFEVHDAPGSGRHGTMTDRLEGWWARLIRATVVCHSGSVADEVRRRWHISDRRLRTFPLAVDLDAFAADANDREAARRRFGFGPAAVVIVVVGRMVPSKRFDLAVDVLAALPAECQAHLLLVGGGPEQPGVEARAAGLGVTDRVVMPGALYGADLAAALHASDVLMSVSDYEGFGLTLVEGMAAALPVVAVAVGGVSDIVVDGETGFLVTPGDVPRLVDTVGKLCMDPERRREMARAGRARAEDRFSTERLAVMFTTVYEEARR